MTDTATAAGTAPVKAAQPRLKQKYKTEITAQLAKDFGFTNVHQVPGLVKIVVNTGVGEAARDGKIIDGAVKDLTAITGQKPQVTAARKSIAQFKLREGPRHPSWRPSLGVPRPPALARASPHPRLPWAVGQAVRWQWQLHIRPHRAVDVP